MNAKAVPKKVRVKSPAKVKARTVKAAPAARSKAVRPKTIRTKAVSKDLSEIPKPKTHCAIIVIAGPPNSGKSTLLNALVGEKVVIVAPKAQTTRLNVRGMLTHGHSQLVFVDTPGLLDPSNKLEMGMRDRAWDAVSHADIVLLLVSPETASQLFVPEHRHLDPAKTILLVNKEDRFGKQGAFECAVKMLARLKLNEVANISALKGDGLPRLLELLASRAPEGPHLYPADELTDQTMRQAAAELVREKALLFLRDEVPHGLAVEIDTYKEREDGLHDIAATIIVERESHKGIVIGAGGQRLKSIGMAARKDLESLAGAQVNLKLWVKVSPGWKDNMGTLKNLGYLKDSK